MMFFEHTSTNELLNAVKIEKSSLVEKVKRTRK